MSVGLTVVVDSAHVRLAFTGPVLCLQLRDRVTADALRRAENAQAELLQRCPDGTLLMTVIEASVPLPGDDVRGVVTDTFKRMAQRNRAAATVVRGDGFWGSAVRSTLTALTMVVRPPCPQRTFAHVPEALDWLAAQAPDAQSEIRRAAGSFTQFVALA